MRLIDRLARWAGIKPQREIDQERQHFYNQLYDPKNFTPKESKDEPERMRANRR